MRYKQWINTDRYALKDVIESRDECLNSKFLSRQIADLSKHDHWSSCQGAVEIFCYLERKCQRWRRCMAIFQKIIRLLSKIQHRVFTGIALSALCSVHPFVVYWREGEPGVMCRVTAASLMVQSTAPLWCVHFCSILCPQYERRYQIEVLSFWHRRTGAGTIHGTGGAKAGTTSTYVCRYHTGTNLKE